MTTTAELRSHTVRELAARAKAQGIPGWHAMRKAELIGALLKRAKAERARKARRSGTRVVKKSSEASAKSARGSCVSGANGKARGRSRRSQKRLDEMKTKMTRSKDLAFGVDAGRNGNGNGKGRQKDRFILMVRDPYWLHAYWELTRSSVDRARAALGQHWHGARPVLRLWELPGEGTTRSEKKVVRDIPVHGGVNNWYIDVDNPPTTFQVDIGYLTVDGKFLCLTRSNVVTTPQVGTAKVSDGNWAGIAADFDRVYALSGGYDGRADGSDLKDLFEERLHRPMGSPMVTRFGMGAQAVARAHRDFQFNVDAELVVYGRVDPDAHVTLKGEPVRLDSDGTFSVRMNLPNRRQVLPVVACGANGVEQRTIVLAVECNRKRMEPVIREPNA